MSNELYKMKLHERIEVRDLFITRVPGGWLYTIYRLDQQAMASTFVPFDNEFQDWHDPAVGF